MDTNDLCMGSNAGVLSQILEGDSIEPGAQAGYELCKLIYLFHPLGGRWSTARLSWLWLSRELSA